MSPASLVSITFALMFSGCQTGSIGQSTAPNNSAQYGENLLVNAPKTYADPNSKHTFDIDRSTYIFKISEPGPKPHGVQLYWEILNIQGGGMRISLEAKGAKGAEIFLRLQQHYGTYEPIGLAQPIQLEDGWKKYEIEFIAESTGNCALSLMLSSIPGEVSIRNVVLQDKKYVPQVPVPEKNLTKTQRDVFDYYDKWIERFKSKKLSTIISTWEKGFVDWYGSPQDSSLPEKAGASRLSTQMDASTKQFTNGPDMIYVSQIAVKGDTMTVSGYRSGSYRQINFNGYPDIGGASFANFFTDSWVKKDGVWWLKKTAYESYKEATDAQITKLKQAHQKLKG